MGSTFYVELPMYVKINPVLTVQKADSKLYSCRRRNSRRGSGFKRRSHRLPQTTSGPHLLRDLRPLNSRDSSKDFSKSFSKDFSREFSKDFSKFSKSSGNVLSTHLSHCPCPLSVGMSLPNMNTNSSMHMSTNTNVQTNSNFNINNNDNNNLVKFPSFRSTLFGGVRKNKSHDTNMINNRSGGSDHFVMVSGASHRANEKG